MRTALIGMLILSASGAMASDQQKELFAKIKLTKAMQKNGCRMTSEQANIEMPKPGLERTTFIKVSRELMAEGRVAFADDEETLLLLPPACKS